MARKNKPCEFCEQDQQISKEGVNGHQLAVEFYPDNGLFAISSFANDETGENCDLVCDFHFDYCPRCGRKIGY